MYYETFEKLEKIWDEYQVYEKYDSDRDSKKRRLLRVYNG